MQRVICEKTMKLQHKVFIKKCELIRDYGLQAFIPRRIKKITALLIINIAIWTMVLEATFTPRVVYLNLSSVQPAMASTEDSVRETGESVIETNDSVKVEAQVSTSQPEIENKIRQAFPEEPETMIAIARAESRMDNSIPPNTNTNGTTDTGIFRINSVHGYSESYLSDIDNNIKVARKIYDTQGKNAWVTYWGKQYLKYL